MLLDCDRDDRDLYREDQSSHRDVPSRSVRLRQDMHNPRTIRDLQRQHRVARGLQYLRITRTLPRDERRPQ